MGTYATLAEVRAQGVTVQRTSNTDVNLLLESESRQIDRWTRRWFEPKTLTKYCDGKNSKVLFFRAPIISITSVTLLNEDGTESTPLESTSYKVYNRHMAGDTDPDDRDNPKIELVSSVWFPGVLLRRFPPGKQNIKVVGKFGYTEYDGVTADGITPPLIKRACLLMVMRHIDPMMDASRRRYSQNAYRITSETRDGSTYGLAAREVGYFTGDPEIDRIIEQYVYEPILGAA